tara:strand:- start:12 stop:554 length:543 start_codon:yes stop_codon:yes gene_type:complete
MSIKATIELDPRVRLKARRSLDGNIMIFDHEDLDIVFLPEKNKCLTFPKESMSDKVYEAQDRMFRFLAKKGVINNSSIRGGNVFGSMEADILESKLPGVDATQVFLFVIHEYINQEKPYFKSSEEYDDERLDALLRPDPDDSTELGDVPQSDNKGSMDSRVRPYGFQYNYSLVRESESED